MGEVADDTQTASKAVAGSCADAQLVGTAFKKNRSYKS